MARRAYIGLGSNLGDRLGNMQAAVEMLMPTAFPSRLSRVYESEPWGFSSEHNFLNAVTEVETDVEPRELLTELHKIEYKLGRDTSGGSRPGLPTSNDGRHGGLPPQDIPSEHFATGEVELYHDRVIDLDLLWYEDFEFESGGFTVPHPWACIRAFVLKPWSELDGQIRLRGIKIEDWLESLPPEELEQTWPRADLALALPSIYSLLRGL